jgi:hypothetical protein
MSAATAYRIVAPEVVERYTFRRFSPVLFGCAAAFWALLTAFIVVAFVRNAPATELSCVRDATVRCRVLRTYPVFGRGEEQVIGDVRRVEREVLRNDARLALVGPSERLMISDRAATDEVRRLQQMRLTRFLDGEETTLDLAYDRPDMPATALLLAPALMLPLLLSLLDRSRVVLRADALAITHVTVGVWPKTRVVPRSRIAATRIDERVLGSGDLRYRIVVALSSGESVSVLRGETSDLDHAEECLGWLRARVGPA